MKTSLVLIAALIAAPVAATECFFRSAVKSNAIGSLEMISDVKQWITPASNGQKKCIVTFKALTPDKQWHNGVGEHVFSALKSDKAGCAIALEQGKAELVNRLFGSSVSGVGEMICNETPEHKTRPVQIGEVVKLSDVSIHPNKPPFKYKGAFCHWFVETSVTDKDMYQYQGIICKTGRPDAETWTVIDKF